jgi:hemoglobin/transferrin/lactoferrin receptor protein
MLRQCLTVALIVASSATDASDPGDDDSGGGVAVQLAEVVVVAARRPQPSDEVAGSVSVIARPEIERLQAEDVRDLVRYEPGVAVAADPQRFGLDGFNIRGVQGNRIAVEIDGVPLPDGFAVGSFSNAGRDLVDPELIERIEILRGPASALYGSDALGGIVAIATRDARDLAGAEESSAALRMSRSTRDQATRASALGAWNTGTFDALLQLSERRGHELANNGDELAPAANPADSARRSAMAKFGRSFDAGRAQLSLDRHAASIATDVRSLINGPGQFSTTESLLGEDREARERVLGDLVLDAPFALVDELALKLYRQIARTEQSSVQRRRANPPRERAPTLRERQFRILQRERGVEITGRTAREGLGAAHALVYGLELSRTEVTERRDGSELNLLSGAFTRTVLGEVLPVRDFPNSRIDEVGLFLADETTLPESPWSALVGLRWDRYRVDANADALYREDNPNRAVVDLADDRLTPKLALRYALGAADMLYFAATEGFRAAPFSDVNIALTLPALNFVVKPNPDLKPERSHGFEFGWNHESETSAWRVAGFDNRYRDLIESRANLGPDASGALVFQSVNRARARIRGIEASAGFDLARHAPALDGTTLRVAAAIARGDDTARDQPLNTVQPARLTLGIERREHGHWPELGLFLTAVERQDRIDRSAADLFEPPGYVALDLRARKTLGRGATLDAAIYNLGDRHYWDWASLRGVLRNNVPAAGFFTAPRRSAALTLTLAW